jgi:hypothetical protein
MADTVIFFPGPGGLIPIKVIDNLDGTYSLDTDASASAGTQGVISDGAAVGATKPVVIGGVDGSGNAQNIITDTNGRLELVARGTLSGLSTAGSPVGLASAGSISATILATGLWNFTGTTFESVRNPNVFKTVSLASATAETTIWTPAASKKFRLMGFILTCGVASTLTFKDNTGGTTIFIARGGVDVPITPNGMGNGILSAAVNNVLTVTRGTACTLDGVVWGTEE